MTSALFILVVFVAFFAEAIVGFGSTVLTVTLGAQLVPLEALLAAFVPVNMVLSTVLVARHPRAVRGALLLRRILPAVGIGMLAGLWLFRLHLGVAMQLAFALFVVVLSVVELARLQRRNAPTPKPLSRGASTVLLLLGGVLHGLYGAGGPMVVYVASREIDDKTAFRSTLSALWLGLNAALVINYASLGLLDRASLLRSLSILPPLVLAIVAGEWVHARVRERPFKIGVFILLLVAGTSLALRSAGQL